MTKQVQLRRGTTVQHSTFTGALGITVDTDTMSLVLHDELTLVVFLTQGKTTLLIKSPFL